MVKYCALFYLLEQIFLAQKSGVEVQSVFGADPVIEDERFATMAIRLVHGTFFHTIQQINATVNSPAAKKRSVLREIILLKGNEVTPNQVLKSLDIKKEDTQVHFTELEKMGLGKIVASKGKRTSNFKKLELEDGENVPPEVSDSLKKIDVKLEMFLASVFKKK